jgi:hypothetical protein
MAYQLDWLDAIAEEQRLALYTDVQARQDLAEELEILVLEGCSLDELLRVATGEL